MSEDVDTWIDAAANARVADVLAAVQVQVPSAIASSVYTGSVRVGLNRLSSPRRTYTDAQYVPQTGSVFVTVLVEEDDIQRADAIAAARSSTRSRVVSAALCTGLAMLSGIDAAIVGPFTGP